MTEQRRKQHNMELLVIFLSQVKEGVMGRTFSTNGEKRNKYRLLVGKPEGKRQLGRPRHRYVNIIKMDLRVRGWSGIELDWSGSGQGQVESSCECSNESFGSVKFWEVLE
jgi:hypothetical protein